MSAKSKLSEAEFLNEWNREVQTAGGTLVTFSNRTGYKPNTAYKRMLALRKEHGWQFGDLGTMTTLNLLKSAQGKSVNGNHQRVTYRKPPKSAREAVPEERVEALLAAALSTDKSWACYAAGVYDMAGQAEVTRGANTGKITVSIRLVHRNKEPLRHVAAVSGGEYRESEDYGVVVWTDAVAQSDFLQAIVPHIHSGNEKIADVARWAEAAAIARMEEDNLAKYIKGEK